MVRHARWFPWVELAALVVLSPVLWVIIRLFASKYRVHEQVIFRQLPPSFTLLSVILSLYVIVRLAGISRWFALAFPLLAVLFYFALATAGAIVWRLY